MRLSARRPVFWSKRILVEAANHAVDDQAGMLDHLVEPRDIAFACT
jgi:hypothetical protein